MVVAQAHPREVLVSGVTERRAARGPRRARSSTSRRSRAYLERELGAHGADRRRAVPRRPLEPDLPRAPRRARVRAAPAAVRQQGQDARTTWAARSRSCRSSRRSTRARRASLAYCDDRRRARRAVLPDGAPARRDPAQGAAGRARRRSRDAAPRSASCSSTRSSICTRSTTRAAGLGDFGKPDGYVERQVTRLDRALHAARRPTTSRRSTEVAAWLAAHTPGRRRRRR